MKFQRMIRTSHKLGSIILFLIIASIAISCNEDEPRTERAVEINTVEELDKMMRTCRESEFLSREEIENNLIGDWQLIGIRSGWVNEFEKKDIRLKIDAEKIVLNDRTTGEIFETDWELKFVEVNSYQYHYLETDEDGFNNRLGMETFCEEMMYGTGRVDDADIYVYYKVD